MLKRAAPEKDFKRSIAILLSFGLVHTIVLLCNTALPFGMVYGPLIYLSFKSAKGELLSFSYLHIIPFLILLFIYVLTFFGIEFSISWAYGLTRFAYVEYYVIIPFSLLVYGCTLLVAIRKSVLSLSQKKILSLLCYIILLYALGLVLSGFQRTNVIILEISIRHLLFIFPLILFATIFFYYFNPGQQRTSLKITNVTGQEDFYGDKTVDEIMQNLNFSMESEQLYRNSAISLEMLAEKINIPKHHLSNFLNAHLGKSFYQFIAEYRVDYAKKKLREDNTITIETLAYECGFNSKTSLNKYFKEVTGFAPSKYRTDASQLP